MSKAGTNKTNSIGSDTAKPQSSNPLNESYVKRFILSCRQEADSAKRKRMLQNKDNFSMYQLEHDFSHKTKGQSKEILAKTRNATEQIKSFFQQALADLDEWWRVTPTNTVDEAALRIKPEEIFKLTNYMLRAAEYFNHVGRTIQLGLLGSLAVTKTTGRLTPKARYITRAEGKGKSYSKHVVMIEDKTWQLAFETIRQENYYPDPTGYDLYKIEESEVDLSYVLELAEGDDAIYEKSAVSGLSPWGNADLQEQKRARETGQDHAIPSMRPKVKLTEFWGNIVDESSGKILAENVVVTLANEDTVIRKPTPNPLWHQKVPIVASPLVDVANSVWGVALMDAGTKHNRTLIELFNLILDGAMKSVWGINQIRTDVLEDPNQVTDGIAWGTNIKVNGSLPHQAKVLEPLLAGEVPAQVLNVFNLLNQETLTSMMTNDLRMGAQSQRAVKATEVVAAENTMTSVFQGMAKNFEERHIQRELELAWKTIAQNWDMIDEDIFKSLFGAERGAELAQMEPQDVFVETVNGCKFQVFGISLTLRRQADFRKWTTLLQVIGGSEVLIEAFLQRYSFEKFLGEIMIALDIDKSKIQNAEQEDPAGLDAASGAEAPGLGPDMASQQPSPAGERQASGGGNPFAEIMSMNGMPGM